MQSEWSQKDFTSVSNVKGEMISAGCSSEVHFDFIALSMIIHHGTIKEIEMSSVFGKNRDAKEPRALSPQDVSWRFVRGAGLGNNALCGTWPLLTSLNFKAAYLC